MAELVRPLLAASGYDLVLVEFGGPSRVLRLYIDIDLDHPPAPAPLAEGDDASSIGGDPARRAVGIDDCTKVSRWVSDLLDAQGVSDSIDGHFNLEVSSPGLDRPLVRPKDYIRFVGREAKVTLRTAAAEKFEGRRRFRGKVLEAAPSEQGTVRFDVDGGEYVFEYAWIEQARLVPEF